MNEADALDLIVFAASTMLTCAAPPVLAAMAIGLLIALFQALTQIQESTLTFVPKMVVVAIVIGFSSTFIGNRFQIFTENVYGRIETGFRK